MEDDLERCRIMKPINTKEIIAYTKKVHKITKQSFRNKKGTAPMLFTCLDSGTVDITAMPQSFDDSRVIDTMNRIAEDKKINPVALIISGQQPLFTLISGDDPLYDRIINKQYTDEDVRKEVIRTKMESRDGLFLVIENDIIQKNGKERLGKDRIIDGMERLWYE